jgi:formylglycine-generating enzyme required for sulfatase activity
MNVKDFAWMVGELEPGVGDAASLAQLADQLYGDGDNEAAATAADLAFTIAPDNEALVALRAEILESLAVREHGLRFRYVPGRCYRVGSNHGDSDEQPVHTVKLSPFWLSDTPISWARFCALLGWPKPQDGLPSDEILNRMSVVRDDGEEDLGNVRVRLLSESKVRLQYCRNTMKPAPGDWHRAYDPKNRYDRKPMVAVAWQEAEYLAHEMLKPTLFGPSVAYRLPTEAEWEAAARGGLLGARYPWGDDPPTPDRCDFNRFREYSIQPSRHHPPNGYGLYGMAGGVWEWTFDWYDARYYFESPRNDPTGPEEGKEHVLRGGSWADCAEAVTASFRMSRASGPFWEQPWGPASPNIGFRLCRVIV